MRALVKNFNYISPKGENVTIENSIILNAVETTHNILDKFTEFDVEVFEILGMRNLSSFIGEIFAASIVKGSNGFFKKNPHQDGYPDLLTMNETGQAIWKKLSTNLRDKSPFSPFENGGLEVKATCGSVPTPALCQKRGLVKPDIGDTRITFLTGYDWKAHHRETNNLLGIIWDFIDNVPRIVAVCYSNLLLEEDWGKIIKPKDGGGRTTSVSIMTREGVKKMYEGILVINDTDRRYVDFLNKYNKSDKLTY